MTVPSELHSGENFRPNPWLIPLKKLVELYEVHDPPENDLRKINVNEHEIFQVVFQSIVEMIAFLLIF